MDLQLHLVDMIPICWGVHVCVYIRMYIHRCICMRVCGHGLSVDEWCVDMD